MEQYVRFSIRTKLVITIVFMIIFVSISIIAATLIMSRNEMKKEIEKRGQTEANNLAHDAKYGVFTEDKVVLDKLISGRMEKPDIVFVEIYREDGMLLAGDKKPPLTSSPTPAYVAPKVVNRPSYPSEKSSEVHSFTAPIMMEEETNREGKDILEDVLFLEKMDGNYQGLMLKRGEVMIGISLEDMNRRMFETFAINVLIVFIVITIAIIMSIPTINKIINPLNAIAQTAMEIAAGDLTKTVTVRTNDEIGVMADNFNRMTDSLKYTIAELEELKDALEQRVKIKTMDLNIAIDELKRANEELKKMDRIKTDFISSVSHELRTPLTSILGFAKLINTSLLRKVIPRLDVLTDPCNEEDKKLKREIDEAQEGLEIIVSEGERLTRLINDVLDIAKMEAGKAEWHTAEVFLVNAVNFAVNLAAAHSKQKGIGINMTMDGNIPNVFYDRDMLIQVITNLLNNAIKFTDHGVIDVFLRNNHKEIEIRITDTGIGIPQNELYIIFERFKQVGDTLTDKPKGTGLGLPICKEIVEHYGGRIWAESELGKGSSFIFTIPVAGG